MFKSLRSIVSFDNFLQLIVGRILFRKTTVQVHRIGNLQMVVDHRGADAGSIRTCLGSSMYKQFMPMLELEPKIRVLDIGANVGGFSLLLKQMGYDIESSTCIELNPKTCERLRFNIKTNIGLHANVENCAIWSQPGELNLELGFGSTSDRVTDNRNTDGMQSSYNIKARTLNEIIDKYFDDNNIDICKIDVEGAESDVFLKSDANCLKIKNVKYLIMEIHHASTYEELLKKLDGFGFKLLQKEPDIEMGVHLFRNAEI